MTRVEELLAMRSAGMLTLGQLIDHLRTEPEVVDPVGLATDATLPDVSSCGFGQRVGQYLRGPR